MVIRLDSQIFITSILTGFPINLALVWFLCLKAYQLSSRRTAVMLFNPEPGRIKGLIIFPRVFV